MNIPLMMGGKTPPFGAGGIEAMMKSGQIWMEGVRDISKAFAAMAQSQMDDTMANWQALAKVKSLDEAKDLHTKFTKSSFERAMAESGKMNASLMKLVGESMQPVKAHMAVTSEPVAAPAILEHGLRGSDT